MRRAPPLPLLPFLLFLPYLLPAQDRVRPYPVRPPAEWQRAVREGTRTEDGRPGPKAWRHELRYRIEAALEPEAARVHGRAELTLVNRSPRKLDRLVVYLRQNLHRADAVRNTRVAITGGMEVTDLRCNGAPLPADRWSVDGTLLNVHPPESLATGEGATLAMDFAFTVPPAGQAPRMGHEDHHVFWLGYWYPQFAVHDDLTGWAAQQYLGAAEFYMPYGDYEVAFTAPAGWLVQATGALQNPEEVLGEAARAALATAAAGHDVVHVVDAAMLAAGTATGKPEGGLLTWRFQAADVRDCAVGVSDRWIWDAARAVVQGRDGAGVDGSCTIHAFYRPQARAWRKAARYAQHTIEYASAKLTPYPWPHMSACEGIIGGGMEYPMMTVIGDMHVPAMQQMVVAHELMHMWFPMQVGSNETAHPWQDEGLTDFVTSYLTADYWRHRSANSATLAEYRAMAAMGADEEPLMRHGDHYVTPMGYGFASYTKPRAILHQLIGLCGEERVFAALAAYVRDWDRRHPTPWDFFRAMNRELGQDLDWYWRTWCYENWRLDQEVADVREGDQDTVVVIRDLGDAPHPSRVRATFADEHTEEQTVPVAHWLAGNRSAELRFGPGVVVVAIDPDQVTLDVDPKNNVWRK
jgi:hypothetical protein